MAEILICNCQTLISYAQTWEVRVKFLLCKCPMLSSMVNQHYSRYYIAAIIRQQAIICNRSMSPYCVTLSHGLLATAQLSSASCAAVTTAYHIVLSYRNVITDLVLGKVFLKSHLTIHIHWIAKQLVAKRNTPTQIDEYNVLLKTCICIKISEKWYIKFIKAICKFGLLTIIFGAL